MYVAGIDSKIHKRTDFHHCYKFDTDGWRQFDTDGCGRWSA